MPVLRHPTLSRGVVQGLREVISVWLEGELVAGWPQFPWADKLGTNRGGSRERFSSNYGRGNFPSSSLEKRHWYGELEPVP